MAKINFTNNQGPSLARKMKATPAKYRESKGRPNISQSDGIRPAFPLMPFAHLPVSFNDVTTTDAVVIPKGRIVSAITSNGGVDVDGDMDGSTYYGVGKGIMGLMIPANGGANRTVVSPVDAGNKIISANSPIGVVEHDVYQDIGGDNLNYDMRNKNWGVLAQQLIKVPAVDTFEFDKFFGEAGKFLDAETGTGSEGGAENITGTYSAELALDNATAVPVDLPFATFSAAYTGAVKSGVTSVSSGGVDLVLATDYTVNAGTNDIQFILDGDAAAEIVVTFVYDLANVDTEGAHDAQSGNGYALCEKEFSFLTYNSEAGQGLSGMLVQPDFYGNYEDGGASKTAQTVGILMGVDYRFGKDMLDTVQSKWEDDAEFGTAGTRTKGVPQFLYDFAYKALGGALAADSTTWAAKWPSKDAAVVIKDAVDAGVFGEAWIQVNV